MAISHAFSNAIPDGTNTNIVRPSDWNSAHNQYLTVTGNTVGQSTFSGTNIVIGGGPNVTISGVNATRFDISAGAGGAGDGGVGISAGANSVSAGTVVFSNSNGISFGLNGSTVTAQHNALTTARASNDAIGLNTAQSNVTWTVNSAGLSFDARGYAGTATGATSASITVNSNGVSVSVGPYITTARASNDAVGLNTAQSNVTWTVNSAGLSLDARGYAGTGSTFNGANVSGSMTVNSVGVQLSLSATQSNQAVSAANGSYAFQTLSLSNANGISFGTSAGSAITASHNALTTARASNDAIGLNTAQSNVTWTVNSSGLSLDARGYAGTGTTFNGANVSGSMTVNSVGVQLSLSAGAGGGETRLTAYAQSNTTQSSSGTIPLSSLNFAGAGIASVGITNGSVVVSVPAGGGAGDGGVFAGVSTGGNTAGSTGTVSTGNFVLVGSQGITLSQSTAGAGSDATVSILGPPPASRYWQGPNFTVGAAAQANSLVSVVPFLVQGPYVASNLRFIGSFTVGSVANNSIAYIDLTVSAVLYSRNGSTLSSILSGSNSMTATWSSNAAGVLRIVTGAKAFNLTHGATTMTPGDYWWAVHVSTTNTATGGAATTALSNAISMFVHHTHSNNVGMPNFGADTNNTQGAVLGQGIISTGATRASIAFSDITVTGTRGAAAGVFFEHRNVTVY